MKRKIKNIFLSLVFLLLIFFFFTFIAILPVRNCLDQETQGELIFLPVDEYYSFDAIPCHDNLNIVTLLFKNPILASKNVFQISISSPEGREIAKQVVSGQNIGDPSEIRIQFEPQASSAKKMFRVSLQPETLSENKIFIATTKNATYAKLFYRPDLSLFSVIKSTGEKMLILIRSDPFFFFILFLIIVFLASTF